MGQERRRFVRTKLSEQAVVMDEAGRMLGRASVAGEGGMLLDASTPAVADELTVGRRLRIDVVLPGKDRFRVEAEVRYREGNSLGLEYVGQRAPAPM